MGEVYFNSYQVLTYGNTEINEPRLDGVVASSLMPQLCGEIKLCNLIVKGTWDVRLHIDSCAFTMQS